MKNGKYKLGDVIRITSKGGFYESYDYALRYFKVPNVFSVNYDGKEYLKLIIPSDFDKQNWVIIDKALHCYSSLDNENNIVYCVENSRKEKLITQSNFFKKRYNVITPYTKKLKKKNKEIKELYKLLQS